MAWGVFALPLAPRAGLATTTGACARCGTRAQIAELVVYTRAPGTVVRCHHCGNVVTVVATIPDELHVDSSAFRMEHEPDER